MAEIYGARALVIMGVTATGKSTVGQALAARLSWSFADGDDLHDVENIAKMRDGQPLTDEDRADWLSRVREWVVARVAEERPCVIACSALKRRYRDGIATGLPELAFIALEADEQTLRLRLRGRTGHFMPATLLASQLADYESPSTDERALILPADQPLPMQLDAILGALGEGAYLP